MPSNLLVTGGAGFVGANFVHHWARAHPEGSLVVLDALTYAGNLASLGALEGGSRFSFVKGDIKDSELVSSILKEKNIDTIVHFAAESHVDRSIYSPDAFIETNILGTFRLLEAARGVWLKGDGRKHCFHHVSTDEVYGSLNPGDPFFTESNTFSPNSPYSASKAASDHLVRAWHHTYGLEVTTSVSSNNFGPYQYPEKLIPIVIINLLENKPLPIYGDGKQIRDWFFVEDHARGIELVLEKGSGGERYNIGGNNEWANIDIVNLICELMEEAFSVNGKYKNQFPNATSVIKGKAKTLITYVKDRPGHDRRYAIDATKIQQELGYSPRESFETGIRKTVSWYLENEAWWRSVLDGSYKDWMDRNYGVND